MMKKILSITSMVLAVFCSVNLMAQITLNHPYNTGTTTIVVPGTGGASYNYFDSGGSGGNYLANHNNANTFVRFDPNAPGAKIQATFSAFSVESSFDALYVWDGQTIGAPKIASANGNPIVNAFWGTGGWWGAVAPNNVAPNTVRASNANASGSLLFGFVCDGSVQLAGWSANVISFICPTCNLSQPTNITVSASANACPGPVTLNVPVTSPQGCLISGSGSLLYQYSVNGGAFENLPSPVPATFTFNNFILGVNTIVWRILDPATGCIPSQVSQTCTVNDTVPPVITCPSSITVNLAPGACCSFVSWAEPTATDNCPAAAGPATLIQQNVPYTNYWSGYAINLVNNGANAIQVTSVNVQAGLAGNPAGNYPIRIFMRTGTHVGNMNSSAGWTEVGAITANVTLGFPGVQLFEVPFTMPYQMAPGSTHGFYAVVNNGAGFGVRMVATIGNAPTTDGTMTISQAPGNWVNGLFGGVAFPGENPRPQLRVTYQIAGQDIEITKITGPDSGDELCYQQSPWEVIYEAEDAAGNTSRCSFDIAVLNFPNPVQSLACNDLVNISVDANCEAVINADMILEGGPYSCYDDYTVELRLNGVLQNPINVVDHRHVGRTLEATVIAPNGNRCWGNVLVEDKILPNLVCEDAFAECGADITPCATTGTVFIPGDTIQFPASFVAHGGGTAFTLQGNNLAGGVYFNLRNNSGSDLSVTGFGIRFGNPAFGQVNAPQTLDIFTAPTFVGNETNPAAWTNRGPAVVDAIPPYFATGTGPLAQARMTAPVIIPAGELRGFHVFGRNACPVFNYFNNTGPFTNGPWTCTGGPVSFALLGNLFQAGAASMPNIQVNTGVQGPAPCLPNGLRLGVDAFLTGNRTYRVSRNTGDPILETCSDVTLTYTDQVNPSGCNGQYWQTVIRSWRAVDASGNASTCTQNINIAKTTLTQFCEELADYDGLDQPAFQCDGNWQRDNNGNPHPSVTGGPGNQACNIQCTYNDINIPLCGASSSARKILRRWTCIDWCEPVNRVLECEQVIKVMDNVEPSVVIQPLALNQALPYTCFYDIRFARPEVTDGCSTNPADPLHNIVRISIEGPGFEGDFFRRVNGIVTIDNQQFPRHIQPGLQAPLRLPVGDHSVTYIAEDACGNIARITVPLILRDIVPPVAICEKFRVASLGPDCRVRIPATSFDDGSYDNCGIVRMEVARMTTSTCYTPASSALVFRDSVDFCCVDITASDAQRTIMFRAVDAAGNSNTCMVLVEVQDKLLPVVTCPANVTVDCRDHFGLEDADLAARFGTATATDNCADQAGQSCFVNLTVINSPDLECRVGSITRVFTATDAANNIARCTQVITVVNNFPFDGSFYRVFAQIANAQTYPLYPNGPFEDNTPGGQKVFPTQSRFNLRPVNTPYPTRWDIVWPADLEVNFCGQALEPDALAANPRFVVGAYPHFNREDFCSQIGRTYDEWEFDFDAGCKKIIRLWKVIDWCQPETVLNPWMWEQVIKVIDNEGPEITAGPYNLCITAEDCNEAVLIEAFATDNCASGDQLRWDWEVFPFGDRNNPIRNTQSNLRGDQLTINRVWPTTPDGGPAHIIKFTVEDGCSNKSTREVEFRVRDCKKPTPICFNGLAVDLMPTSGMADVAAVLWNAGSYDNCTQQPNLRYRIERMMTSDGVTVPNETVLTVDCDDLGSLQVRMWVGDEFGNWDFCETYILVQNNMGADCDDITGDIAGKVFTENNEGVEEAKVDVNSSGLNSKFDMTNVAGNFMVSAAMYNTYEVKPFRNDNAANGVSTLDILLIQRHILGLQNLNSPYKLIAADANKTGTITAADLVEIRKVILGKADMFAGNTSWRFVPTDYVFNNPANAQGEAFPESRIINGLSANMMNENFYGIKIGDVNGSAKANSQSVSGSISRSRSLDLNVADMNLVAGNDYEVAFRASDIANVLGYQFTLNFRPEVVDFVGFEAGALNVTEENFGFTMLKDGMITTSWNTTAPVAVTGEEVLFTMTFRAKTNAMLSEVLTANSRYTSAEAISLEGGEIGLNLVFNTENGAVAAGTYELYQNVPNPFANETLIGFSLPEAMDATLTIYDVSGKVVKQVQGSFAKGLNNVVVSKGELPSAGVLYYQLEAGSFKASKKMIVLE
jgi:hypothetical protein